MELILVSIGLGVLGLDVVGALLILMALAQGVSRRSVVLFSLIVLIGTAVYGVFLSLLLGESINEIAALLRQVPLATFKIAQLVLVGLLVLWICIRLLSRNQKSRIKRLARFQKILSRGMVVVAILFVITAVLDPSFLALVAASGREGIFFDIIAAHLIWSFVGQIPLYVLTVAMVFRKEKIITEWFKRLWKRNGKKLAMIFTFLIGVFTVALLVDATIFFINL